MGKQLQLQKAFRKLRNQYSSGAISSYEYLSRAHEFNKLLLYYPEILKNSPIKEISITQDGVKFLLPEGIELYTDGGARTAPFEILNFNRYESQDEAICIKLLQIGGNVFDIGANIGWFSVLMAKMGQNSNIFSFEPIPITYNFLKKNIAINKIKNVHTYNLAFSEKAGEEDFFYFKSGSAIASLKNLIHHEKASKIACKVETLDRFYSNNPVKGINLIKIDTEGSELLVLKGACNLLQSERPPIMVEIVDEWCNEFGHEPKDVIDFLLSKGYEMFVSTKGGHLEKVRKTRSSDSGLYNYFFFHPSNTVNKRLFQFHCH